MCPFSLISESLSILLPLAILGVVRRWGGLPKTLRDELRDSLPFILRSAPINGVLCGPGRPYV